MRPTLDTKCTLKGAQRAICKSLKVRQCCNPPPSATPKLTMTAFCAVLCAGSEPCATEWNSPESSRAG
eukprot:13256106-Alexandrium_andersonii.AAC.1